jgi:hypothetical protein
LVELKKEIKITGETVHHDALQLRYLQPEMLLLF